MEDVRKREMIKEFAQKHIEWNKDQIIIGFPEKDKGEIINLTKNFSVMVQVEQQDHPHPLQHVLPVSHQ